MEKRSQVEMLSKRIFWAPNVRGNGGIRTHNENFCHELINYAVRIGIGFISNFLLKLEFYI